MLTPAEAQLCEMYQIAAGESMAPGWSCFGLFVQRFVEVHQLIDEHGPGGVIGWV